MKLSNKITITAILHKTCFILLFFLIPWTAFCQSLSDQLYTFDFGLLDDPVPERTKLLSDLGYNGFSFNVSTQAQRNKLQQYLQTEELKSGKLTIPAVYYGYRFNNNQESGNNPKWKEVMNAIPVETDFWLIIDDPAATPNKLRTLLSEVSEEAVRLGKDVVIYPHDNNYIESAEDIIPFLEELDLDNLYVTFHLCHELRDGNRERLRDAFEAARPYLKYVSIAGALNTLNPNANGNWTDAIRPLDDSELDLLEVVKIFEEFNYNGPVVLHTFGIKRAPEDHLASSMKVWRAMTDRIQIGGSFEAEDFAIKSGNVDIENTPNTNGDQNLGLIRTNDFVEYFVEVAEEGTYRFDIAASSSGAGGFVDIYVNNNLEETIQIPVNGNWHEYTSYSAMINLTKGAQRLKLVFRGTPGQFLFNIDRMDVLSETVLSNQDFENAPSLSVYPNPSKNGVFYFNTPHEYQLYDLQGRKILEDKGRSVDISNQPKGTYFLRVAATVVKLLR